MARLRRRKVKACPACVARKQTPCKAGGKRERKRPAGGKGRVWDAFQETGDSRLWFVRIYCDRGTKYGVLRIWARRKPMRAVGAEMVAVPLVLSTRTSARRSRTLVQLHTPTHTRGCRGRLQGFCWRMRWRRSSRRPGLEVPVCCGFWQRVDRMDGCVDGWMDGWMCGGRRIRRR